eukprot:15349512-Heterocapsa_arctica.AAC.1
MRAMCIQSICSRDVAPASDTIGLERTPTPRDINRLTFDPEPKRVPDVTPHHGHTRNGPFGLQVSLGGQRCEAVVV